MNIRLNTSYVTLCVAGLLGWSCAADACDDLIGNVITKHLRPAVEELDCSIPGKAGLDKKGHKLNKICYESTGPTSHIRIDTSLNCHSSSESVVSKALGGNNTPSISENVTAEAEARGSDCKLLNVEVKPSGELGKLLAKIFDANGRARLALEQGLADVCSK